MKKGNVITMIVGSAALLAGAAALAAKDFGRKYVPPEKAESEDEATADVPEEAAEEVKETAEVAEEAVEVVPEEAEEVEDLSDYTGEAIEDAADQVEEAEKEEASDLEQYIELNPEERANLDTVKDSFAAEGVRTDISFTGNTMFFDFVMTDVEDEETKEILKPDLEQFLEDQCDSYRGIVKQIEEDTGFDDIKMIVIFMDANEEEIVSGHYDDTGRIL